MKKCKFCAEDIQDAAIKCKHCGADVAGAFFKSDAKDVAQGVKKAQFDEGVNKVANFFAGVVAGVIGFIVGGLSENAAAGWITFFVVWMVLGILAYRSFLKK
jgi:F0F1-type ATP synthase assembly protein I